MLTTTNRVVFDAKTVLKFVRAPGFVGEARRHDRAQQISPLGVVPLHDSVQTPEGGYLVTPRAQGDVLDHVVQNGPLKLEEMSRFVVGVAATMHKLHARDLPHGDLKLENVVLWQGEEHEQSYRLINFGGGFTRTMDRIAGQWIARCASANERTVAWSEGCVHTPRVPCVLRTGELPKSCRFTCGTQ